MVCLFTIVPGASSQSSNIALGRLKNTNVVMQMHSSRYSSTSPWYLESDFVLDYPVKRTIKPKVLFYILTCCEHLSPYTSGTTYIRCISGFSALSTRFPVFSLCNYTRGK